IKEGKKRNLRVIPGIEISSKCVGGTLHILGFGIDINARQFLEDLNQFQNIRKNRNIKIISKLHEIGIKVSLTEILNNNPMIKSLGRPHIASLLIKKGIVKTMDQAFSEYLGEKGKAFVRKEVLESAETIGMIHNAGGKAIIAHPSTLNLAGGSFVDYIKMLMTEGLDGMEVFSSAHQPDQIQFYKDICLNNDLLISAGSDFHGSIKKNVSIGICNSGKRATEDMVSNGLTTLCR
ncbi:MAG: PHP domain-containing protein, partial [SAR324 cluster bacterium]|nr:PHP domain-containing protein [SAR324 cluster bacterium]